MQGAAACRAELFFLGKLVFDGFYRQNRQVILAFVDSHAAGIDDFLQLRLSFGQVGCVLHLIKKAGLFGWSPLFAGGAELAEYAFAKRSCSS